MLMNLTKDYIDYLPQAVSVLKNPQTDIPRIAKDKKLLKQIESAVQQIPGYKILGKLGAGAMAVVYKGKQLSLNRTVAIKVLPKRFT